MRGVTGPQVRYDGGVPRRPDDAPNQPSESAAADVTLRWAGKDAPFRPRGEGPLELREIAGDPGAAQGRLVWADNALALAALRAEIGATVDLVYIDPPFDVGASHYLRSDDVEVEAYRDAWGGAGYLSMLYPRLVLLRALMKPGATIVVHVGVGVCHRVRVLMDELFGADSFVNQIAWKRYSAHNDAGQGARRLGAVHDVLLVYGRGPARAWTTLRVPHDPAYVAKWYRHVEPQTGRRFMSGPLTAPGGAAKGNPRYEFLGVKRHWRYGQATMEELLRVGRVYQSRPGAVPRQKHYLDELEGVPLQDVWTDIRALQGTHAERLGYDTQKPEALLERIVQMCSRPGDLVLDAFAGSGTTAAVAARCGRRWIAVDRSPQACAVIRRRLRGLIARGEAGGFSVLDGGPAARRAALRERGEAALVERALRLHGAESWPRGQIAGRRGAAAVVVAVGEARPGAAEVARWLDAARAAGMAALEVLAWEFHPSAHDAADGGAASLWELPRALADDEDAAPRRLPCPSVALRGEVVELVDFVSEAGQGVASVVEWAIDWAWDGRVFAPRWWTQRGRDGALTGASPPLPAEAGEVLVEAVDAAGRIGQRLVRYRK